MLLVRKSIFFIKNLNISLSFILNKDEKSEVGLLSISYMN